MCERVHVCVAEREEKGSGRVWRGGEGDRMHLNMHIDALPVHPAPPCTRAEQLEVCARKSVGARSTEHLLFVRLCVFLAWVK